MLDILKFVLSDLPQFVGTVILIIVAGVMIGFIAERCRRG